MRTKKKKNKRYDLGDFLIFLNMYNLEMLNLD